jgi:putative flippase GtrA
MQWLQFATVGISNAVVDLGVLNIMLALWPPGRNQFLLTFENSLAVALAIANSYLWNTRWTFAAQADGSLRQAGLFIAQSLLNIGINDAALLVTNGLFLQVHLGPSWVSVNLSKGVAMIFASGTSFFIMRGYVFAVGRLPGGRAPAEAAAAVPADAGAPEADRDQAVLRDLVSLDGAGPRAESGAGAVLPERDRPGEGA